MRRPLLALVATTGSLALAVPVLAAGALHEGVGIFAPDGGTVVPAPASPRIGTIEVGTEARQRLQVVLFQSGSGLVEDVRLVSAPAGPSRFRVRDLAPLTEPGSGWIEALGGRPTPVILDQRLEERDISATRLLRAHEGREITVFIDQKPVKGLLVSADGPLISIEGRIHLASPGAIAVPGIPASVPTEARWAGQWRASESLDRVPVAFRTLVRNLGWSARYDLVLSPDSKRGQITAWATLTNGSGTDYPAARISLVSGAIRRVGAQVVPGAYTRMARMGEAAASSADEAEEMPAGDDAGDVRTYDLPETLDLTSGSTVESQWWKVASGGFKRRFEVHGHTPWYVSEQPDTEVRQPVESHLRLENRKPDGPGLSIPSGKWRVWVRRKDGPLTLTGEVMSRSVAPQDTLDLHTGEALDVTARRSRFLVDRVRNERKDWVPIVEWKLEWTNARSEPAEVVWTEPLATNWQVLASEADARSVGPNQVRLSGTIPPGQKRVFMVRVKANP
jgi:hypothetical protein